MSAVIGSYKNKDGKTFVTIELKDNPDSQWGFSFGLSKAKLIMRHLKEIKQFIEDQDNKNQGLRY